jgi:uronate dehydrogenase
MCVRIGNVAVKPLDARRLAIWISPRDLAQLIGIGLDHPDLRYEIVYGLSKNQPAWWDNRNATRLGYRPTDSSEPYAEDVLAHAPPEDPDSIAARCQGGNFAISERGGDPSKSDQPQ